MNSDVLYKKTKNSIKLYSVVSFKNVTISVVIVLYIFKTVQSVRRDLLVPVRRE